MKVGLLLTRIRKDEKAIIKSLEEKNIEVEILFDKEIHFSLECGIENSASGNISFHEKKPKIDILLERSTHHARALYTIEICEAHGISTINKTKTANTCGNKFLLTQELIKANLPLPKSAIAFTKETAMQAVEKIGYPVVLKPAVGSWGRLLAKANDEDAAKAIIEHKKMLGSYHHSVFYIEEFIKKDTEYKILVIDNKVITAIKRISNYWISHEDENERKEKVQINKELETLAIKASQAIGGDIVAVDILEKKGRYYIIDIDYTVEFHNHFKNEVDLIMKKVAELIEKKVKKPTNI